MSSEGRLSPAELDDLLDPDRGRPGPAQLPASRRTSTPDHSQQPAYGTSEPGAPTQTETLESGEEGPTWTARTGGRLRRHPRLTAAAVALLLVAGIGWQGYQRTRPPPLDTRMPTEAWFAPSPSDQQGVSIQGALAVSTLYVPLPPGVPPVTVVALTWQGLGPSTVTRSGSDVTVQNPLACNAIADLSKATSLPVLQLTRTDAWGRTVSATVEVSDSPGTAAIPASVVTGTLRQECVGRIADSLTVQSAVARTGPVGGPATLVLRVANPTRHDLLLLGAQAGNDPNDATIGSSAGTSDLNPQPPAGTLLPAGATVDATLPVRRTDCGNLPSQWAGSDATVSQDGRRTGDLTLWVAAPQAVPDFSLQNWTSLGLTPAERAAVVAALAAPCTGAPRLSYTSSAAATARNTSNRSVTFRVRARASEGTAALVTPIQVFFWSSPSWASDQEPDGHSLVATVTVDIGDCSTPFAAMSPPTLGATVTTASGKYPFQLTLGSRSVLDTLTGLCHQSLDLGLARKTGWAV